MEIETLATTTAAARRPLDRLPPLQPLGLPREVRPVYHGLKELLPAIRQLSPEIAARAEEIERGRHLPPDLFKKIAASGVMHMLVSSELGGVEYSLSDIVPVIEELARADGSTAWNVLVATETFAIWRHFEPNVSTAIITRERDVMTRAPLTPRGLATPVENGFILKGRWSLGSGSFENDWFLFGAVISKNESASEGSSGGLCICAVPAAAARTIETWDAIGLRSTRSDDVVVDDIFVPTDHCIPLPWVNTDGPTISRLPMWLVFGPFHCAMVLGVAQSALAELVSLAKTKRPLLNPAIRMAEDPLVQFRIGQIDTRLSAARSLLLRECDQAWALASAHEPIAMGDRARFRSMIAFVHSECMAIVNDIFTLAGSNVLYNSSSLQRRFRDIRAACQHVIANTEVFRPFGATLLGEPPPDSLL